MIQQVSIDPGFSDVPSSKMLRRRALGARFSKTLPILVVLCMLVAVWYAAALYYDTGYLKSYYANIGTPGAWSHLDVLQQWRQALNSQSSVLPAPHQVVSNIWTRLNESDTAPSNLWADLRTTSIEAIFGFGLGSLLAVALAYLFVSSRLLELSLFPYVVMSQTIPIIALVPALVVILGVGFESKVIVASYLTFYPVTVSTVKGLRSVDPLSEDLMKSYAASGRQTLFKLRFPASLPYLFTGLKVGVTASLIGAIVAELPVGSQTGLGVSILGASSSGQTVYLWGTIVAVGILGLAMYGIVVSAERLFVRSRSLGT